MRALRLGAAAILGLAAGLPIGTAAADGYIARPTDPYIYVAPAALPLTYDWTGFYIGGNVGAAHTSTEFSYDAIVDPIFFLPEQFGISTAGFVGGGFVGAQKQWSWLLLGVEAGYLWIDQSGSTVSAFNPNVTLTRGVSNLFLVTGKFGWTWDNILGYFKGGWASGDVEFRTSTTGTGTPLTTSSGRENGWTAGAGLEYALWDHVILGVEYDYIQLNPGTRTQEPVGAGPSGTHISGGVDIQSVTARLSFKFGGSRVEVDPVK
ncbi:MAG TPA: outer membrane beta-barrel protein [Hyphomicrobiaceae bacterium]|nr:outer membrane beta-barrel protein [Hyphomicrobiaceae bacterium]